MEDPPFLESGRLPPIKGGGSYRKVASFSGRLTCSSFRVTALPNGWPSLSCWRRDVSLQLGESVGSFVGQRRQPGKGASGQKGALGQKGRPSGRSPKSSWAHLAVLGRLAFGPGLARALVLSRLAGGFEIRAHGTHTKCFFI